MKCAAHQEVNGEADLAVQQEPEVLGATTAVVGAATEVIDFLQSPEAAAVYLKRGLQPAKR